MPVINGYEASEEILNFYKEKNLHDKITICAHTAYSDL